MDDTHEALSAIRRDLRRVEDDQALLSRKKASNEDVEMLSKKQSDMETESRNKLQSIQSELHSMNENFRKLVTAFEALSDDLTKHKRKVANELEEVAAPTKAKGAEGKDKGDRADRPFLPMQLQITLYILAGVGLMALIQNAPAAIMTIPRLSLGG